MAARVRGAARGAGEGEAKGSLLPKEAASVSGRARWSADHAFAAAAMACRTRAGVIGSRGGAVHCAGSTAPGEGRWEMFRCAVAGQQQVGLNQGLAVLQPRHEEGGAPSTCGGEVCAVRFDG